MGVCVDCKYHRTGDGRISSCGYSITHICTNPNNVKTDNVTGNKEYASCYEFNKYAECEYYEES